MADKSKIEPKPDEKKITLIDKDGDSVVLSGIKLVEKDSKAKAKRSDKKANEKKPTDKDVEWDVNYTPPTDANGQTSWSFGHGNSAIIEVHCPTRAELKTDPNMKPKVHVKLNGPEIDVNVELDGEKAQNKMIADLKKLFGTNK
jgi:hypothetical protein